MLHTETFLHEWSGEIAAPLCLVENTVKPEWVDEFQHLNMAHYLTICDQANWAFWNWLNAPAMMQQRQGREYSIVENHVIYSGELAEGARFSIHTQLCACDDKRYILFHRVLNADGETAATNEVKCLGFNLHSRRAEAWGEPVRTRLTQVLAAHAALPPPPQAGQGIVLKKR